ncbi:hypothetical protein MTR_1g050230 [Medicago truncatula]|uniref:Disease resistance protein At4g27190-like leucine-rich repeats domain-containing protein n=1 Tax=Medicago truncatula TaxID=3880 RepID=G7I7A8_MEDTR|nr:hypothetical protein MTR_1g050230 [Medicago truncatula]
MTSSEAEGHQKQKFSSEAISSPEATFDPLIKLKIQSIDKVQVYNHYLHYSVFCLRYKTRQQPCLQKLYVQDGNEFEAYSSKDYTQIRGTGLLPCCGRNQDNCLCLCLSFLCSVLFRCNLTLIISSEALKLLLKFYQKKYFLREKENTIQPPPPPPPFFCFSPSDDTNEIVFCSLQTLELISLQRLCRFCSCPCPIKFPLLEVVVVKECPRMELFSLGFTKTTNLQNVQTDEGNHWEGDLNRTINKMFCDKVAFGKLKYLALSDYPELKDVWYGQLHCNVFCNLKHLVVERCDFLSHVLFPSNVMQVLQTLEELEVKDCDSLEAVFDVKGMKSQEILIKANSQLKRLSLSTLPKFKHIWNEDPHEIISFGKLCKVDVSMCQSLLYIFPYSLCVDLGHLKMLEIESCGVKEASNLKLCWNLIN